MLQAVVLQHEILEGPGLLETALEEAGFEVLVRYRDVQPEDEDADLVVVLGGTPGAHEPDLADLLMRETSLLEARLQMGRPSLGICLGAQLLATAAGAQVRPGDDGMEVGVMPVQITEAAREDPVFGPMPPIFETMCWHADTFDAVPGATLLASSAQYPHQAFRVGRSYGTQFHPEVTPRVLAAWLGAWEEQLEEAGRDLDELVADDLPRLVEAQPVLEGLVQRLANFFAEVA
jgi:GMP synthase (glutamine-hydrolysing)